jgi:hypothetical protein
MRPLRWLPEVAGVVCVAALAGFAVRPYEQIVRGHPNAATAALVAGLQRAQHLPVDPSRLYAEDTLYWVIWYVGAPTVLLGGLGLALLARKTSRALLNWPRPRRLRRGTGAAAGGHRMGNRCRAVAAWHVARSAGRSLRCR